MKRFGKLLCFMVVFIAVIVVFCTVSFAATVGQQLKNPEAGWTRYNEDDPRIRFSGHYNGNSDVNCYNSTQKWIAGFESNIKFKFYGTKLRIIESRHKTRAPYVKITVDGISEIYALGNNSNTLTYQILTYEKSNLISGIHTVVLEFANEDEADTIHSIDLDAIDIDQSGYLIDFNQPTDLISTPGNAKVDLSWEAVEGVMSYIVKRSETPTGPYETITTTSAITCTDTGVTNGITYYYVVTAIVNNVESDPSNEASATPTAPNNPEPSGNSAILEITMVTGEIKEYDFTAAELQSFLSWYGSRSNGADKSYYMIPKKNNIKPFLRRKEYIAFDKISSFEVKEYND